MSNLLAPFRLRYLFKWESALLRRWATFSCLKEFGRAISIVLLVDSFALAPGSDLVEPRISIQLAGRRLFR
jgi:hypothetical protein